MFRKIITKNLRIAFSLPVLLCMAILLLAFMIFPSAGLSEVQASKPIEMLLPFVGVVLMSAVFLPEQDRTVRESVYCRRIGLETIRFLRVLIAFVILVVFVAAFCLSLRENECAVNRYMIWGGISSALFMGGITYCVAGISDHPMNGILAAVVYYVSNYGWKTKLGVFYLFRMSSGTFSGKTWLFAVGVLLIAAAFLADRWKRKSGRLVRRSVQ
ncbi:MAG: hypothetical protein ACI4FY_07715 [Acetatifactor sp.]